MFCKFCGREINDQIKFCPYCGGQLIIEEAKEEEKEEKFEETNVINVFTKVLYAFSIAVLIASFLPYNQIVPLLSLVGALILVIINVIIYIKNRSKYNLFLMILDFVLILTNINSIVLYNIL